MSGRAYLPSLRFGRDGTVAATAAGCFDWTVHRRTVPVAFLATSLAGLGDAEMLDASIEVEPGAAGVVTAQGPSSLLRTEREAVQRWSLRVGAAAHLTFLPWLTLPYPGSRSRHEVLVQLDAGATLCAWDLLAAGRIARGERLELAELSTRWTLRGPDGPLLDDRLRIDARFRDEAAAALGRSTHLGTLYLSGFPDASLPLDEVRGRLEGLELAGASRPAPGLVVVRALDRSAERLEQAFWPLVSLARSTAGARALSPADVARRWLGGAAARS